MENNYLQELPKGCGHICEDCKKDGKNNVEKILEELNKRDHKNNMMPCNCHCHSCHH